MHYKVCPLSLGCALLLTTTIKHSDYGSRQRLAAQVPVCGAQICTFLGHLSPCAWDTGLFVIVCKMQRLSFLAALLHPTVHHHQEAGWCLWDTDGFVLASCNGVNVISFKCCLAVIFFSRRNVKFGVKEYFSSPEAFL